MRTVPRSEPGRSHASLRPRVHASLRNLAIGVIGHTAYRSVNIAAATRQLARQPDVALERPGVPPLLCK